MCTLCLEPVTKPAIILARVSRDASGEGQSTQRQLDACRKLADPRGWQVVEQYIDNSISAYSGADRSAYRDVQARMATGDVDLLLAWHIDRMPRTMLDLELLITLGEEKDIGLVTARGDIDLTNDVGRMVARILATVARAEVERKAARQRLANAPTHRRDSPTPEGPGSLATSRMAAPSSLPRPMPSVSQLIGS